MYSTFDRQANLNRPIGEVLSLALNYPSLTHRFLQDELQEEAVQQDPAKMDEVLNRLSKLQEDAERNRVYDLNTKVQRIMDLMGFQIR